MANSYNQSPIILTATMASGWKALCNLGSPLGAVLVEKVYWENPTTIGDVVTVVDPDDSAVLLPLRCEVANQSQVLDWTASPRRWRDFKLTTINSGTLYLYTR